MWKSRRFVPTSATRTAAIRTKWSTPTTPQEDVKRRDFTINGLMLDPFTNEVLDFVGGRKDLSAGIIRAIGNPDERFREDKLRMIRAVRFAARFRYAIESRTFIAITKLADGNSSSFSRADSR